MTNLSDIILSCCKSKQSWVSEHSFTKKDNVLPNLKFYKWYKFVWCKRERESEGVRRKVWLMAKDSHQPVTNRKVGIPTFVHQVCLSPLECVSWRVWESSLLERCNLLMISCIRLYFVCTERVSAHKQLWYYNAGFKKGKIETWTPWYLKFYILLHTYLVV